MDSDFPTLAQSLRASVSGGSAAPSLHRESCLGEFFTAQEQLALFFALAPAPLAAVLIGGANEGGKQGMRLQRLRLKFRMELAAQEPRVVFDFDDLDVSAVRS